MLGDFLAEAKGYENGGQYEETKDRHTGAVNGFGIDIEDSQNREEGNDYPHAGVTRDHSRGGENATFIDFIPMNRLMDDCSCNPSDHHRGGNFKRKVKPDRKGENFSA